MSKSGGLEEGASVMSGLPTDKPPPGAKKSEEEKEEGKEKRTTPGGAGSGKGGKVVDSSEVDISLYFFIVMLLSLQECQSFRKLGVTLGSKRVADLAKGRTVRTSVLTPGVPVKVK